MLMHPWTGASISRLFTMRSEGHLPGHLPAVYNAIRGPSPGPSPCVRSLAHLFPKLKPELLPAFRLRSNLPAHSRWSGGWWRTPWAAVGGTVSDVHAHVSHPHAHVSHPHRSSFPGASLSGLLFAPLWDSSIIALFFPGASLSDCCLVTGTGRGIWSNTATDCSEDADQCEFLLMSAVSRLISAVFRLICD